MKTPTKSLDSFKKFGNFADLLLETAPWKNFNLI